MEVRLLPPFKMTPAKERRETALKAEADIEKFLYLTNIAIGEAAEKGCLSLEVDTEMLYSMNHVCQQTIRNRIESAGYTIETDSDSDSADAKNNFCISW